MDKSLRILNNSLEGLDTLQDQLVRVNADILRVWTMPLEKSPSSLDIYDYLASLSFGVIGAAISTNKQIASFLEKVHTDASKEKPNSFLGRLLHHSGDPIDQATTGDGVKMFLTRDGSIPEVGFHRLMRGHDIFSIKGDNPFQILCEQNGILKGIVQVFQHLTADTFSKQGLPIPFHSFFDYHKSGKMSNWLKEITDNTRQGTGINRVTAFDHMFTIRMQDVLAQGLTCALCMAYFYMRGINDKIRRSEIRIIAYSSNLFTHAAIGMVRQGGVPYISWPALSLLLKELYTFFRLNYQEIKQLQIVTDGIVQANIRLEEQVFHIGKSLPTLTNGQGYIEELKKQDFLFGDLVDFLGEGM